MTIYIVTITMKIDGIHYISEKIFPVPLVAVGHAVPHALRAANLVRFSSRATAYTGVHLPSWKGSCCVQVKQLGEE